MNGARNPKLFHCHPITRGNGMIFDVFVLGFSILSVPPVKTFCFSCKQMCNLVPNLVSNLNPFGVSFATELIQSSRRILV